MHDMRLNKPCANAFLMKSVLAWQHSEQLTVSKFAETNCTLVTTRARISRTSNGRMPSVCEEHRNISNPKTQYRLVRSYKGDTFLASATASSVSLLWIKAESQGKFLSFKSPPLNAYTGQGDYTFWTTSIAGHMSLRIVYPEFEVWTQRNVTLW